MKKRIAIILLALVMLMLAACGSKAATAPSATETQPETQATEAPTQGPAPVYEPAAAGVYRQPWKEEIDGKVVEGYSYIVLNEDHTGCWIAQGVATLTWDEKQIKTTVGEVCGVALTRENGTVNLLVYPDARFSDTQTAKVFEKIEKLPAEMEAAIAEDAVSMNNELDYPGVYWRSWSEEIGGTVVEMNSYIVLNEDRTGYWIAQDVGTLTWDESQLTLTVGATYDIALTQENGIVKLLVFEFQDNPSVYEKIEKLPAEIENMIAAS